MKITRPAGAAAGPLQRLGISASGRKKDKKKEKTPACTVHWLIYFGTTCFLTEEHAVEKITALVIPRNTLGREEGGPEVTAEKRINLFSVVQ